MYVHMYRLCFFEYFYVCVSSDEDLLMQENKLFSIQLSLLQWSLAKPKLKYAA